MLTTNRFLASNTIDRQRLTPNDKFRSCHSRRRVTQKRLLSQPIRNSPITRLYPQATINMRHPSCGTFLDYVACDIVRDFRRTPTDAMSAVYPKPKLHDDLEPKRRQPCSSLPQTLNVEK
jgi:hypothetical protein